MHAGTNIPALFAMISKGGGPIGGRNINNASGTKGGKRGAVEVKLAKDLVISGEFGVDLGGSEQVECDDGLWEELIPETSREALVSAIQDRGEVVFKGTNGAFSWIVAMIVCSNQLEFELLLLDFL